jgi:hypothetical protein
VWRPAISQMARPASRLARETAERASLSDLMPRLFPACPPVTRRYLTATCQRH